MACVFSSGASADFGIVTYGPDFAALGRTAAAIALRMFKGTKPADIPFEQAMHFEMTVNARNAKAVGITIPRTILVRASRIIE